MIYNDVINGGLECAGGLLVLLYNVRAVLRTRSVAGVHWLPVLFFAAWGVWNLHYYPALGQWCSFAGSVVVCAANLLWCVLLVYFRRPTVARCANCDTPTKQSCRDWCMESCSHESRYRQHQAD